MPLLSQQNELSILSSHTHLCEDEIDNHNHKYFGLHILWHDEKKERKKEKQCNNFEMKTRRQWSSICTSKMNFLWKAFILKKC